MLDAVEMFVEIFDLPDTASKPGLVISDF